MAAGRMSADNGDFKLGQAVGDAVATVTGTAEALFGGGEAVVTSPAELTVVGAAIPAAGAVVAVHGASTATVAGSNLINAAMQSSGSPGPYSRPTNATTPEQRAGVQGKPCSTCGATGQKNVADHKTPLVVEHYQKGTIDKQNMRSSGAVQPQCQSCSNRQGAYLRSFSKAMKKLFFGNQNGN